MIHKTIYKLFALILMPLFIIGCFEDHASQFHLDDANQVEWAPPDRSTNSLSYSATIEPDQTDPLVLEFEVQLIGAQAGADRTAGVAVSETDGSEGVHFELLTTEVVISSNSNHGQVEVQINSGALENGESFSFSLELQEGPELGVATNMKDLFVDVEKLEPDDD